jgi:methylmalonyl-CoA mutase N-terminal domain/subunit
VDAGRRVVVGVNRYRVDDEDPIEIHRIDPALERKQIGRLESVRAKRQSEPVERSLSALRDAAASERNLMEPLLDCARAHASEGEIVESLQRVFGTYTETPVF